MKNTNLKENLVILKLEKPHVINLNEFTRITGLIKVRRLVDLFTKLDLEANPRSSKISNITKSITATLNDEPELLPFKSKGLLLGSSQCVSLERDRFQLDFVQRDIEGILDGGHNALAIAMFLLEVAGVSKSELKRVATWKEMKSIWNEHLEELKKISVDSENSKINSCLPIEILAPAENDDEFSAYNFLSNILAICAARNNNAQLAQETIANQGGVFDDLKKYLPEEIKINVGWRSNEPARIDVRFLVAVIWSLLSRIEMPQGISPITGSAIYSSKAEAVKRFEQLISHPDISTRAENKVEVKNELVISVFELVPRLLEVVDLVYKNFRDAYNANNGKFGGISAVKTINSNLTSSRYRPNMTPFFGKKYDHEAPPAGFVMPIVSAIGQLMEINAETGKAEWVIDPVEFFSDQDKMISIVGQMKGTMELAHFDPQRVGKSSAAYGVVERELQFAKLLHAKLRK